MSGPGVDGRHAEAVTEVSVRVQGDARPLYRLADPLLALLVRRSVRRDQRTLKRLLEQDGAGG